MVKSGIGKNINCMIVTLRKVLMLIMWFTLTIINKWFPKDNMCTISDLRLITITYQFTNCIPGMDVFSKVFKNCLYVSILYISKTGDFVPTNN